MTCSADRPYSIRAVHERHYRRLFREFAGTVSAALLMSAVIFR